MSSAREQTATRRKRQRTEALDDPSELQPSERLRSGTKLHSAAFYDSLSKVWLTRRALKELDRRASQPKSPQPPASAHLHRYRQDTWRQIKRFARHGGPELRDLRGHPAPTNVTRTMDSSHSSRSRQTKSIVPTNTSSKTKRSSAYDGDFEQHLIDHHIYTEEYDYPDGCPTPEPSNLEGFYQRLAQPRPSLSPSHFTASDFKDFKQKNARVLSERKVMRTVLPIISSHVDIPNEGDLVFTRLEPIANSTTVDAKPDFYDGAHLEDINGGVREDLGQYIIPTGHAKAPVAPNFFLEAKAPKGGADVAKRQACYDGALGARAMHQLQSYKQEPMYDGNAYTISSTYHAGTGTLQMYTTHPTELSDGTTEYHMNQVDTWGLTGNPTSFRRGATAFRNARDWAQEQRDAFISVANERARNIIAEPAPFASSLDDAASNPINVKDPAYPTEAADPMDDAPYHMSQPALEDEGVGHLHTEPSMFESSNFYDSSDEKDIYPAEEPETSPDELALETFPEPSSNKQRHRLSKKTASKVPRHSDDKTRRKHRSKP